MRRVGSRNLTRRCQFSDGGDGGYSDDGDGDGDGDGDSQCKFGGDFFSILPSFVGSVVGYKVARPRLGSPVVPTAT